MRRIYRDRWEAGRVLASHLKGQPIGSNPLALALPRGGVPVGVEIAEALDVPLQIFLVRKLGVPAQPELAMGAIASGGVPLLDKPLIDEVGLSEEEVGAVIRRETQALRQREELYHVKKLPELDSRPVIVVDDGLATGFTMRAAVAVLRRAGCPRIAAAVPVGAKSTCDELEREVDLLICPLRPERFRAVGEWYDDFSAISDEEVRQYLARDGRLEGRPSPAEH